MKQIIYILTILFLTSCGDSNMTDNSVALQDNKFTIIFPIEAKPKNPDKLFEDTLIVTVNKNDFLITPEGNLHWGQNPRDTFQLFTDVFIERAFLYLQSDTLLIFYTETDHDGATSRFEKINLTSRQRILKAEIYGFNLGLPYLVDNFAYVTTIGVVGKLNLDNGQYIYQHSDLYDDKKYSFNSFDSIVFQDSMTIFLSENYHSKHMDSLVINEKTGKRTIKK